MVFSVKTIMILMIQNTSCLKISLFLYLFEIRVFVFDDNL